MPGIANEIQGAFQRLFGKIEAVFNGLPALRKEASGPAVELFLEVSRILGGLLHSGFHAQGSLPCGFDCFLKRGIVEIFQRGILEC